MKHFLTTALLCGTAILAAQAQNVIVTDKDGIPHKYNADYVQEITFEKIGTPEPEVFDRVSVTPYGDKCFMLQLFRDNFLVQLELYQPSAYFLQPGQYVVRSKNEQGGYDDFSINKDWYWIGDYPDEQLQMTLTGGTLDVELDGEVYTMALDLAFEDDKKIVGTYSGTINKFGPTLNYNLTNCRSVDVNEPAPNGFYYKFNDSDYGVEMGINLFSDGFAPAPGTYTFSDTMENGTATSNVDIYSPYVNTKFKEGTVTVTETDVEIEGTLETGVKMTAKYSGELPPRNIAFNKVEIGPYSFGKTWVTLPLSNEKYYVQIELNQPSSEYVQPGEYVVSDKNEAGGYDEFTITKSFSWIGVWDDSAGSYVEVEPRMALSGGTLNVTLQRNVYTMKLDLVFENGERIVGTYNGTIGDFGPNVTLDYELTGCSAVDVNEPAPNGFYYRFSDSDYNVEMRIDLFSDGFAPAPGTYTFSDTMENGTATSNVDLYSPYESTKFKEGTVTVTETDGQPVVEIDGTLETGVKMTARYSGELPPRNIAFNKVEIGPYSFGKTWVLLPLSNDKYYVQIELNQPSSEYVQPGEYVVSDKNEAGGYDEFTITKSFSWIGVWDDSAGSYVEVEPRMALSGGTLNVTLQRNVYTMKLDLVFENGERIVGTYSGTIDNFGPKTIEYKLTGCSAVSVNEPAPNGFYYRFYDSDYNVEMRIDLFSEGDKVAPGTYTFSDTMENGTAASNVDLYSPYENTKFKEGTVTVSEADGQTVVEIAGTLENELKVTARYEGKLPARPSETN